MKNNSAASLTSTGSITVVVPAYNAADYLEECLLSICAHPEVSQIIVVNDGSTDGTLGLARKASEHDGRILVLDTNNSGVAAARNLGMLRASGAFLSFVDADDTVPPGAFSLLLDKAQAHSADMVYGSFAVMTKTSVTLAPEVFPEKHGELVSPRDVLLSLTSSDSESISGSCCRILFRTAFLRDNALAFPEGIRMSEDFSFILDCLSAGPVICHIDEIVYRVRRESVSATQRYMPHLEEDMSFVNERLKAVCCNDPELVNNYIECVVNTAWYACGTLFKEGSPYRGFERLHRIKTIMSRYDFEMRSIKPGGGFSAKKYILLKIGLSAPPLLWVLLTIRAFAMQRAKVDRRSR